MTHNSNPVMISIQPQWCALIANGAKTVEVRRRRPLQEAPFKCYIYCTKTSRNKLWLGENIAYIDAKKCSDDHELANGMVIGEFLCDRIVEFKVFENGTIQNYMWFALSTNTQLTYDEIVNYIRPGNTGYGWNISQLKIYKHPKLLSDFGLAKPPESWTYLKERVSEFG